MTEEFIPPTGTDAASAGEGEWCCARVAARVRAAVIDSHLHQPETRHERLQYVDGLLTLLRQASDGIERNAR